MCELSNLCRSFLTTTFFRLFVNLRMLVPAGYILGIYDGVLMNGSGPTPMVLSRI
ncbi:MAG: hypothetical protein HOO98_13285 [Nitrospira sp.]|jgi:ABC-type protease/lipase transport system fused ATPase/permease subunit|nr:hypothetical protein [Nitrospira sp.]